VAEWLRNGLQNRVHQFNSGRGLHLNLLIYLTYFIESCSVKPDCYPEMIKRIALSAALFLFSTVIALGLAEAILRVKNSSMKNYDIEMWRYARELKVPSPDPKMGHDHVKQSEAVLQSVNIRLNEWGLRGGPVAAHPSRRILFVGGSITLGWGVKEDDTITARVQRILREQEPGVEVLNGGVGNYNAEPRTTIASEQKGPLSAIG
jgi:hypothetical protein